MADTDAARSTRACAACQKAETPRAALSRCAGCKDSFYCSRECQRADWKQHKQHCGSPKATAGPKQPKTSAQSGNASSSSAPSGNFAFNMLKDQLWGGKSTWLHGRPEEETFNLLIDCHRLRNEDELNFRGDVCEFYAGKDPVPDFRRSLVKAEAKGGVLPPWWSPAKREACVV